MATTMIATATGSQNILSNQKVLDMSDRIYLLEPQAAPLYVLVSRLNKRVAINTTVQWLEDEHTSTVIRKNIELFPLYSIR